MKILFISPRYEGGIGGHARRVAEKLNENNIQVKLMHVPHIPIKKLKNPSFVIFGIFMVLLMREKFDIAHAFNAPSAFVMRFVNSKKKVLAVHGVYSEQIGLIHSQLTSSVVSKFETRVLKWADVLTTDSKIVQETYKKQLGVDIVHLPAPLDTGELDKIPPKKKLNDQVVYVGRDSYEKGIDVLKKIEDRINAKVVYCTNLSWQNAMAILQESSILVVPSRIESIPQTIKEAFYLKTAVIATEVGGIPEIVENKVTGILVPPENPDELLRCINSLLCDNEKRDRIIENAFEFINKNFSWDTLLTKYLGFYENLVSEG